MAYYSQERKAGIAPQVKAVLKKYGMKGSLSVDNHSTVVLTLKSGPLNFFPSGSNYGSIDVYHYDHHYRNNPKELAFLSEVISLLNEGNHDNSDIQSDYFDVGWYVDINIGKWDKPYILEN